MINFETIRPDGTGKFSPLLYKWLTSPRRRSFDYQHVFQTANFLDPREVFRDNWSMNEIIIGHGDFDQHGNACSIGGRKLRSIIAVERGSKGMSFYYTAAWKLRDISEQFWAEYQRIGRCAWDHSHTLHMIGDDKRFHYIAGGRQRECLWCSRVFEVELRILEQKPTVKEVWSEYRESVPATLLYPMSSCGEAV